MFNDIVYEVLERLEEGVVIVDKKGRIQYINLRAAQIDSISKETAVGRLILEIYPSLTEKTSSLLKVLKHREPILENIQTYRNYKGEDITTKNSTYPIFKGKRLVGAVDISKYAPQNERNSNEIILGDPSLCKEEANDLIKGTAKYDFIDIIGKSDELLRAKGKANKVAKTTSPVLIYGETGTGKELFVHAIHNNSNRKGMPFIAQNCAAIPSNLLESMLFGTSKGSFTGAENKKGLLDIVNGGTLYFDELNSMPLELQAKLLRFLQEGNYSRVGETKTKEVDIRIIASLNEDPGKLVEQGTLRKDLYYRLNVVRIDLPPLRERKEDITILIKHFIGTFNKKFGATIDGIHKEALKELIAMDWMGNVRQLEHFIEGIFNEKQSGIIDLSDIYSINLYKEVKAIMPLKEKLMEIEASYIKEALAATDNNVTKAAELLHLPRQSLQYKMKNINKAKHIKN